MTISCLYLSYSLTLLQPRATKVEIFAPFGVEWKFQDRYKSILKVYWPNNDIQFICTTALSHIFIYLRKITISDKPLCLNYLSLQKLHVICNHEIWAISNPFSNFSFFSTLRFAVLIATLRYFPGFAPVILDI